MRTYSDGDIEDEREAAMFDEDRMACGCIDYHMADCPRMTERFEFYQDTDLEDMSWGDPVLEEDVV